MDHWDPALYQRFQQQRREPFDRLVSLCQPLDGGTIYDLGCGPGNLTIELPQRLGADRVVGVDSSPAMLAQARQQSSATASFVESDIADFEPDDIPELIFSNAALHWVPHHEDLLLRLRQLLSSGGQLAIQVPCNDDHPAYPLATQVAMGMPEVFPDGVPPLATVNVLAPEAYASALHKLGATETYVALHVFCHELPTSSTVVDWMRSTTLNPFKQAALSEEAFDLFIDRYRSNVSERLGNAKPFLFTFKRILLWAAF